MGKAYCGYAKGGTKSTHYLANKSRKTIMNLESNALTGILEMPTVVDNVHESCFRSYHILRQVLIMIDRDDSIETILEVVDLLRSAKEPVNA